MVVVAIVAFLAGIAIPRYMKHYEKSRQAEVAILLASLHTSEEIYWAEHGKYTTNLNELDWKPNGHYTYGFYFPGAKQGVNYIIGKLGIPAKKLGKCYAYNDTFLAKAVGKINLWSVDETRTIKKIS
jgi:Tfp pilus assembly protein PilE